MLRFAGTPDLTATIHQNKYPKLFFSRLQFFQGECAFLPFCLFLRAVDPVDFLLTRKKKKEERRPGEIRLKTLLAS